MEERPEEWCAEELRAAAETICTFRRKERPTEKAECFSDNDLNIALALETLAYLMQGIVRPTREQRERCPELCSIQDELIVQDSCATKWPIFVVQKQRRIYGVSGDYTENFVWLCRADADDEAAEAEQVWPEAEYRTTGAIPDGWERVGYQDVWEDAQIFLTRKAADRYMFRQQHNLGVARVFVKSAHDNPEWQAVVGSILNGALLEVMSKAVQ